MIGETTLNDLISRAELLKYFSFSPDGVKYRLQDADNFPATVTLSQVQEAIHNATTVESTPVVCGKWSDAIDIDTGVLIGFRCSNCDVKWDYMTEDCPSCGAKMDL